MELEQLQTKYHALEPVLTERTRRLWAATEARALGHGGIALVERATGISRSTIVRGLAELQVGTVLPAERTRRPGGGRKAKVVGDRTLQRDLDALVEPTAAGLPDAPLRWTSRSVRHLAAALAGQGHRVSYHLVGSLLHDEGYTLQGNRKTREGSSHPDRDAQFGYLNEQVRRRLRQHQPAISVDTKKKELVGDFKNGGREWRPAGQPELVRVHDFLIEGQGKAVPYGVYDLHRNEGWVSVGISHDTASFAAHSIARWWEEMGRPAYPQARRLLLTADAGGSNGPHTRLWKWELQQLANATGLTITVCHFPPGTSKWNKIEHRLFSFISQNWRGQPLISLAVIVSLIGATSTLGGLHVRSEMDPGNYPQGVTITDAQMATVRLRRHAFHRDWNYTIRPQPQHTKSLS